MRLKSVKLTHFAATVPPSSALALIFDGRENLNKAPA